MRDDEEPQLTEADKRAIEAISRELDRDFGPWGGAEFGGGRRDGIVGPIAYTPKRRPNGLLMAFAVGAAMLTAAGALALVSVSEPRGTAVASRPAPATSAAPLAAEDPPASARPRAAPAPTPHVPPSPRATALGAVADGAVAAPVPDAAGPEPPITRRTARRSHTAWRGPTPTRDTHRSAAAPRASAPTQRPSIALVISRMASMPPVSAAQAP